MLGFGLGLSHAAMMGGGDEAFHQNFLLPYGAAIEQAARKGAVLSFSRASNATQRDASGNIVWAPHNIVTYSNDFENADWGKAGTGTGSAPSITANAVVAPNGTLTGSTIVFDRGAGNAAGDQSDLSSTPIVAVTQNYTGGFYLKATNPADVGKEIAIRHVSAGTYTVVTLTASWTRYTPTETGLAGSRVLQLGNRGTVTADNSVSVDVCWASLNVGNAAQDYIATTTAAYYGPRFDHDSAGNRIGFLREGAGTNECLQSEDFSTTWTQTGTSVVSTNTTVAPDGNTTADTLTDDDAAAYEKVTSNSVTILDSETWCYSLFIKKDSTPASTRWAYIQLVMSGGTTTAGRLYVDTTGFVSAVVGSGTGTLVDSGIIDEGDYWRVWIAFKNNATGNTVLKVDVFPAAGDTALGTLDATITGSIIAWGSQTEIGNKPTSYIPTTTTAVTRAADVLDTGGDLTWWDRVKGTFYLSYIPPNDGLNSDARRYLLHGIDTGFNRFALRVADTGANKQPMAILGDGTVVISQEPTTTQIANTVNKVAFAYNASAVRYALNGVGEAETATGFVDASAFTEFDIGGKDGGQAIDGHIQEMKFWNVDKSAAAVLGLTA
jgi:hypothetical protein